VWPPLRADGTGKVLLGVLVDGNVHGEVVVGVGRKQVGAMLDERTHHRHLSKARGAVQRRPPVLVQLCARTVSVSPTHMRAMGAVCRTAFTSAPQLSRSDTMAACPLHAAECSAVSPSSFAWFTPAPARSACRTSSISPSSAPSATRPRRRQHTHTYIHTYIHRHTHAHTMMLLKRTQQ
jgi:hypothetical protein